MKCILNSSSFEMYFVQFAWNVTIRITVIGLAVETTLGTIGPADFLSAKYYIVGMREKSHWHLVVRFSEPTHGQRDYRFGFGTKNFKVNRIARMSFKMQNRTMSPVCQRHWLDHPRATLTSVYIVQCSLFVDRRQPKPIQCIHSNFIYII